MNQIYEPTGQGQRKVVPGSTGAPAPPPQVPPQPGLAGLARQVQTQKMGGPLPSTNLPQALMGLPKPQPSLDPLTEALLMRELGVQ